MFSAVEKYNGPAKIMLGLIAITFIGFGASTVAAPGSDYIVKVGDEKISTQNVQTTVREEGLESNQDALAVLIDRAYLYEGARAMGINVSLEQLKQVIMADKGFQDENGRFNEQKFRNFLAQSGLTEDQLIENLRRQFELQNVANLAANGNIVSSQQLERIAKLMQAEREIRTAVVDPRNFAAGVKVDDAALKAYYDKDKSKYLIPKAVKFEYIELSAKTLADRQTVSEEEVKKAFAEQQSSAQPKQEVSHIMFALTQGGDKAKIKAEAEKVLAEAKAAPDNFATLAQKYSQDTATAQSGGALGVVDKSSALPEEFKAAIAKLNKGEIALVESTAGFHVVRITNTQGQQSFDEAKASLEAELKQKKAQQALAQMRQTLSQTTFDFPDSLKAAAEKTGLPIQSHNEWLSRQNAVQQNIPAEWLEVLFSDEVFKKKHNSDVITVGDTSWVLRATETREESTPAFEQVKEQVRTAYVNSESAKAAMDQAKKLLAELQKGGKPELAWSEKETLSASDARLRLSPQALAALAKAHPTEGKPAYALLEGQPAPLLVEVLSSKVQKADADESKKLKNELAQRTGLGMYTGLLTYLKTNIPLKQGAQKLDSDKH
ncbi:SurA N-terminal domain-containing protein [Neisseria elongata]|jgi:peptidyl-prolyl cis-trans isomerase D|uniref:SurA N-terminal domain-containing protein n=1 Tax=Neisseria elongata TaxID=495 RepID=UPI000D33CCFF|nr:SurA N-terminal domain-containing protein [Neisseria elongata]